jgi:hypothetical protein
MQNIITRGLASPLLVTQGYGLFETQVIALAQRQMILRGRRPPEDSDYDVLISARLIEVNGIEPPVQIKGYVRVSFSKDESRAPRVKIVQRKSVEVMKNEIVVRASRVRRSKKDR